MRTPSPPGAPRGEGSAPPSRRPTSRRLATGSQGRYGYLFLTPFVLAFLVGIVAPLLYAAYLSFFQERMVGGTTFVGFDNYARALEDQLLRAGLWRVALFLAIQVPLMLGLALLAALAIDSGLLRWAPLFRIGIFIPYAVPAVVASLMWGYLYGDRFGLVRQIGDGLGVDTPNLLGSSWMLASIGNVVTWEFVGYNMLILYAALRVIPEELYEAAAIDGAGEFRKAWSIKLPALRPALLLASVFSVIGSFQLFNEPNIMQSLAPNVVTTSYTPNMYAYNLAFNGQQFNYSAAVAVILGLVTAVVAFAVQVSGSRKEHAQ
ncbi:sugar ABC transporter permease [Wenjunlia vitaminophila]|uniref:Sugar ABC transporter permease n=1 Tax=Wenjunlia vitaminophila TaxID=76728 RepID=A0A0T6LQD0_WENVI|nr:sugar ABC transporter permease [Wenjunlia vitaminophila]